MGATNGQEQAMQIDGEGVVVVKCSEQESLKSNGFLGEGCNERDPFGHRGRTDELLNIFLLQQRRGVKNHEPHGVPFFT